MHFNRIMEYGVNGGVSKANLLSHPLYFLQNGDKELINEPNGNLAKYGKMLLILYSMPFAYGNPEIKSFFNHKGVNNVGYEMVPYGYLVLLGGILYRERELVQNNVDIVRTGDYYKNPGKDGTFLVKNNGKISFGIIKKGSNINYISRDEIINPNMDIYVKNKLIRIFTDFCDNAYNNIKDLEIKLMPTDGINKIPFTYSTYVDFVTNTCVKSKVLKGILEGTETFTILGDQGTSNTVPGTSKVVDYNVCNFGEYYSVGFVNEAKLMLYYNENSKYLQKMFTTLYDHKAGVNTLVCQTSGDGGNGLIKGSSYRSIVNSFAATLNYLCKNKDEENKSNTPNDLSLSKNAADDDLKKSIYLYLKQFWDKWLCRVYNTNYREQKKTMSEGKENMMPFSTQWLKDRFLFIDSFYYDISQRLKLNCSTLVTVYENALGVDNTSNISVYGHLASIAERHGCKIFCYPDFIDFRANNEDTFTPMEDMFKPLSYNNMNPIEPENRFVVIFTTGAQVGSDRGGFRCDSFDIKSMWDGDDDNIRPAMFDEKFNDKNYRIGYMVPAFGVSYSKQNNSIFKQIDVGMDSIQITSQSLSSMSYIAEQGNMNKRAVTFYGNDIYNVYTSYSYLVTITMMGNAQIQPLMYFQLMNVPLFRGTYIVIDVSHSIRPGDFTTTIKGMRMTCVEMPMNNAWFTVEPETSNGDYGKKLNNGIDCNDYIE